MAQKKRGARSNCRNTLPTLFFNYALRDVSYRITANRCAISGTYRRTPSGKKNRTSCPARMASRTKVDETSIIGAATARTSAVSSRAISGTG